MSEEKIKKALEEKVEGEKLAEEELASVAGGVGEKEEKDKENCYGMHRA